MTELQINTYIENLTPFMYGVVAATVPVTVASSTSKDTAPVAPVAPDTTVTTPRQKDSLMWCCYAANFGAAEYMVAAGATDVRKTEIDFRTKLAEDVARDPSRIKYSNQKITKVVAEEIKSNFMTGTPFGLPELIAFCIYREITAHVVFAEGRAYLDIVPHSAPKNEIWIIYDARARKFSFSHDRAADERKEGALNIEQYNKPLRGFSSYKTEELKTIATVLGIESSPVAKKDIYEKIRERIAEFYVTASAS